MIILLANDHALYCDGLKLLLETLSDGGYSVESVACYQDILNFLRGIVPKLLILDLSMSDMQGVAGIRELCDGWPSLPVLVISGNNDPLLIKASIEAGAAGYLTKSYGGDEMLAAVRQVLSTGAHIPPEALDASLPRFSTKQVQILHLLAEGLGNREIARQTHLSEGTVKQYIHDIMPKLGVENRVQAGIRARKILGLGD